MQVLICLQGKQVLVLRHSLSGWKEILLATKAILLWEKQWHPTAIIGCTSILFMFVWLADPSILTMLSMIGLTVTLADYLVPLIGPSIFKKDSWTNTEEVAYEDLCRSMVVYKTKMMVSFYYYVLMRTTRPKMVRIRWVKPLWYKRISLIIFQYYSCTITILVLLTWLGMSVNNLFLMYIVVTTLLLYPGLEHQGLLRKYSSKVSGKIGEYKAQAQLSFNGFHAKKE